MRMFDKSPESLWGQIKQVAREFFRGGRKRVSSLAGTIDRQAGIQKLAAQIRSLRRERQQLLLTMGKKAYSLHTRGKVRNRDILEDCLHIDEIGADINQVEARIEEIRRQGRPGDQLILDIADETPVVDEEEPSEEVVSVTMEAESVEKHVAEQAEEQTAPAEAETPEEHRTAESVDEDEEAKT